MPENINPEEKFKKDAMWMLSELKQEELANRYSEYKIKFWVTKRSDIEPDDRSQQRILRMLSDRKAVELSPLYHRMSLMNTALAIKGNGDPIGYDMQIFQPQFDEVYEEITHQKVTIPPIAPKNPPKQNASPDIDKDEKYFVTLSQKRQVTLNNTFILSSPNFDTENHNFIEYILENPGKVLSKQEVEEGVKKKLKKNFHSILHDLGFRGEIRKIFFDVSKVSIQFKNNILPSELKKMNIDREKLETELSGLERIDKKEKETARDARKQ